MNGNFSEEAKEVLMEAKVEMASLRHPYVGSEHLFLALLKLDNDIKEKLKEYHVTYDSFKNKMIDTIGLGNVESNLLLYTPLLKRVIENAILDSRETNHGIVLTSHLFSSLLEEGEGIAVRLLLSFDVPLEEVYDSFKTSLIGKKKGKKLLLDSIGVDLSKKALEGKLDPVVGREKEIRRVLEILCRRSKNNPILVGEAGVGKTAIVEEVARRIALREVPDLLKDKRIISVSMSNFVSGTKYRGEFEERMGKVVSEIENNDDIILFIDEVHTLVGAGGAEGAIDASNILKPALARGNVRLIGATTILEYKKSFEKDAALERRFQKVMVEEANREETLFILKKLRPIYEQFHHVIIKEELLEDIISLSEEYLKERFEPDRSIDLLDEVSSYVHLKETKKMDKLNALKSTLKQIHQDKNTYAKKGDFKKASLLKKEESKMIKEINDFELSFYSKNKHRVTKKDIIHVLNEKTGLSLLENVSVFEFNQAFKGAIQKPLEELKKIYIKIKKGIKVSVLFYGSSGVGKTYLVNTLSSVCKRNVIKLDMSEYQSHTSISKMIGSIYFEGKTLCDEVSMHPFSIMILEGIEKAHPDVLKIIKKILEEEKLKDSKGRTIYFNHVTIFMTCEVEEKEALGFNNQNQNLLSNFEDSFLSFVSNFIYLKKIEEKDAKTFLEKEIKKRGILLSKEKKKEIIKSSNYLKYGYKKIASLLKEEENVF